MKAIAGSRRWRRACVAAAVVCCTVAVSSIGAMYAGAASPAPSHIVRDDFNGDGIPDLAIGVPGADGQRGAVDVLDGSGSGLSTLHALRLTVDSLGIAGVRSRAGDEFGYAITTGDFNGDGITDLAVGAPGHSSVFVVFGSRSGLRHGGSQAVNATRPLGAWSLAAADFNGDGYDDLAVGSPFAKAGQQPGGGAVKIYSGSPTGLVSATAQRIAQKTPGVPGPPPSIDGDFGLALATGDFNGDDFADLAIGQPGPGAYVFYGSPAGLTPANARFLRTFGTNGGFALAVGDFNGDGYADLAVGAPVTYTSAPKAGLVEIHPGSSSGITDVRYGTAPVFAEITPGMPGPMTADSDLFGYSLASGDINGDGFADLVVGVPGKSAAIVLRGSGTGLTVQDSQFLPGVGPQATSQFAATGVSVAAADFNGDGAADVVLGEPFATTTQPAAGVAEVFAGSSAGATDTTLGSAPLFSESTAGMPGSAGANDNFGLSLATTGGSFIGAWDR